MPNTCQQKGQPDGREQKANCPASVPLPCSTHKSHFSTPIMIGFQLSLAFFFFFFNSVLKIKQMWSRHNLVAHSIPACFFRRCQTKATDRSPPHLPNKHISQNCPSPGLFKTAKPVLNSQIKSARRLMNPNQFTNLAIELVGPG